VYDVQKELLQEAYSDCSKWVVSVDNPHDFFLCTASEVKLLRHFGIRSEIDYDDFIKLIRSRLSLSNGVFSYDSHIVFTGTNAYFLFASRSTFQFGKVIAQAIGGRIHGFMFLSYPDLEFIGSYSAVKKGYLAPEVSRILIALSSVIKFNLGKVL